VYSALHRKESRGSHQRLDGFEQRDDVNFLKHSLATYAAGGAPRISYGGVKITKSEPATRAYGAEGEKAEAQRKQQSPPGRPEAPTPPRGAGADGALGAKGAAHG